MKKALTESQIEDLALALLDYLGGEDPEFVSRGRLNLFHRRADVSEDDARRIESKASQLLSQP